MLSVIETVQLPESVQRHFADPYQNVFMDSFSRNQVYFKPLNPSQDAMLFEKITENFSYDPKIRAYPDRKPSVQLHHVFVKIWEQMQMDERNNSICHRIYWLGESWQTDDIDNQLISSYLVKTLAERVKRFKKNIGMHELVPYVPEIEINRPHTYRAGESYQDWFYQSKGKSRYDWDVVNAFAKGKAIEPILTATAFGYTTPVLTADEIERVYLELKSNPEPKTEIRHTVDHADKFNQLANAVAQLVEIQSKQLNKKGKTDE